MAISTSYISFQGPLTRPALQGSRIMTSLHIALHAERLCAVNLKHYHHFNGSRIERLVCALHTVLFMQDLNFEGIVFI